MFLLLWFLGFLVFLFWITHGIIMYTLPLLVVYGLWRFYRLYRSVRTYTEPRIVSVVPKSVIVADEEDPF